jgi:hypothetical protein
MPVTSEAELREEIARRLDTMSLPVAGQQKMFGGPGNNQLCNCCDDLIPRGDVLYEVELDRGGSPIILAMHRRCFDIWMEESRSRHPRPEL